MQQVEIYGLDIETDGRGDGVDPTVAAVSSVALSGRNFDELFRGDEATLLGQLDQRLASLRPGVVATWNGATFDLPFIADRARLLGVSLDLRLRLDHSLTCHRTPLPGHAGAYRGSWGGHAHLDTFRLYGHPSPTPAWSLRTIARLVGLGGTNGQVHPVPDLVNEARHAHAPSDARLARVLADRRLAAALRLVDQLDEIDAEPVTVAAQRMERRARLDHARGPAVATA